MKPITVGKLRGLQQIFSRRGTSTALALDHRQNLRNANPAFTDDEELSRFKLDVTSALAKRATAVLLDPEVSAAQAIAQHAIPHDYETFLRQVTVDCNAGASGIAVGRAVWKEAMNMQAGQRREFLETTGKYRVSQLTSLCNALARPYTDFYTADAPFDWYRTY